MAAMCYQRDSDGKPQLHKSLVCHADVLGYKSRLKGAYANGTESELLLSLDSALAESRDLLETLATPFSSEEPARFAVKIFSDNIAIGYPLSDKSEASLLQALDHISLLQTVIAAKGFLLRGGLAIGSHFMDENLVFGKAFVEATELDVKRKAPRITLTPALAALMLERAENANQHFWSSRGYEGPPEWYSLLVDDHGEMFINYLDAAFGAFPDGAVFKDLLEGHRDMVLTGLKGSDDEDKFQWAAQYHNFVCSEFSENCVYRAVPYDMLGPASLERTRVGELLIPDIPQHYAIKRII